MESNGIGDLGQFDFMNKGMYPMSQIDRSYYASPTQVPLAAQAAASDYDPETNPLTGEPVSRFAKGGIATLHYAEGDQVEDPTPAPTMADLYDQLNTAYRTNSNYDDIWKQFAATKSQDPAEWYRKQLGFLGGQQGWQVGQNTGERGAALKPQIDNTIAEAKAAGLTDKEISSILGSSSQSANAANQQRIAQLGEIGGTGFSFQKDLQPGIAMLALAAAAAATGGAAAPALEGAEVGGAAAMGPTYAELGYIPAAEATGTTGVGAETLAQTGPTYGELGYTPQAGPTYGELGYTPPTGPTYSELGYTGLPEGAAGPTYGELGYTGANQTQAIAEADAAAKIAAEKGTEGLTANQLRAANMGLKALSSAVNGSSGQGGTTGTSGTPAMQAPSQQYIQPTMLAQQKYGELYRPYTYDYSPRRAAQGGLMYANGGGISTLGSYSDGGQLLKGAGDGMSDDIPAHIGGDQPAALADGEFVIPADVVSHLGNGSTDAGAKQLYKMMDRIREARTGNSKQGKQINPDKFLPKG